MATLPKYYNTGTVSVANGATAVTGVGTAWANQIKASDYFRRAGLSVRVASVTDNTHLTLAENWPGTTLSGSAYEISITYDGPEFQLRTRELLENFAGLATWFTAASTAGPSKLFLYEDTDNGTSKIALQAASALGADRAFTLPDVDVTINAFAAQFLDDASASAVRATLAIGWETLVSGGSLPATITLPSGYRRFRLTLEDINWSAINPLFLQTHPSVGAGPDGGASDYSNQKTNAASSDSLVILLTEANTSNSNQRYWGTVDFYAGSGSSMSAFLIDAVYIDDAAAYKNYKAAGRRKSVAAIAKVSVFQGAGSILSGSYSLEGMRT